MQTVDVYIGTSLRGRASGPGRVMYIMRVKLKSGNVHESDPEAAEYDDATESSLVLYAIRDAIARMNYACRIVIHTECNYVAAALNQHWPEEWRRNGWRNAKEKEIKNAVLWSMLLEDLEESGHLMEAESGKHEWSEWMQWKLPFTAPLKNVFKKLAKVPQNQ